MKALILNSGIGSRMGVYTANQPKCLTYISETQTILSRQLQLLMNIGVKDVIMTTGYFNKELEEYCKSLNMDINFTFVKNNIYDKTNYIYSIYCAKEYLINQDIVMMHGDLVFSEKVLKEVIKYNKSCMVVSSTLPLPQKDFKAVIHEDRILKVGINFFENTMAAQPLYKLNSKDWNIWLKRIVEYCENGQVNCYAENAFNEISNNCQVYTLDIKNDLCLEIDNPNDLRLVRKKLLTIL